jgi:redox-sensitive bicupin YhaK (pirin superfamily)
VESVGVAPEPECLGHDSPAVDLVIRARQKDLGGFTVRRTLPSSRRRLMGPFIFFDHMGPAELPAGTGIDVRPHPHIGLATVTYLFEGEIFHRDTLGSAQSIVPGDVNWMVAGRGIAHSERTSPEVRARGHAYHGIQAWVALPRADEECTPSFVHHPGSELPRVVRDGMELRVIAGDAFGGRSPVRTSSPTLYVDARLSAGAELLVPDDAEERAVYVATGRIGCGGGVFEAGDMVVLRPGVRVAVRAENEVTVLLLGGAPLDGARFIDWNFVSSSEQRILRAREDWKAGRFGKIPGDDIEFVPLPERRPPA